MLSISQCFSSMKLHFYKTVGAVLAKTRWKSSKFWFFSKSKKLAIIDKIYFGKMPLCKN